MFDDVYLDRTQYSRVSRERSGPSPMSISYSAIAQRRGTAIEGEIRWSPAGNHGSASALSAIMHRRSEAADYDQRL